MVTKFRIVHVLNVRWFNATAWYGLRLAFLQQQAGHDVRVITIPNTDTDIHAQKLGIPRAHINLNSNTPWGAVTAFTHISSFLQTFSPDIVNCHRGESFILWGLAKLRYPFRLVRTRGDQRLPKSNFPNKILHKYIADAIISTNSCMTNALEKAFSLSKNTVYTICGGVDRIQFSFTAEGRELIRGRYGFTNQDCVLGILGRYDWVKGQQEIIIALGELLKEQPLLPIKVLLIGFSAGIQESTIQEWIQEAGIQEYVVSTGKCENIPAHISALDIGILSSLGSETIARAALEIISCGVPLLSTNVGVMPDIIPEHLCMHLPTDRKDTKQICSVFKASIADIIQNKAKQKALQKAGREAMEWLTDACFLEKTMEVYNNVLSKG